MSDTFTQAFKLCGSLNRQLQAKGSRVNADFGPIGTAWRIETDDGRYKFEWTPGVVVTIAVSQEDGVCDIYGVPTPEDAMTWIEQNVS